MKRNWPMEQSRAAFWLAQIWNILRRSKAAKGDSK